MTEPKQMMRCEAWEECNHKSCAHRVPHDDAWGCTGWCHILDSLPVCKPWPPRACTCDEPQPGVVYAFSERKPERGTSIFLADVSNHEWCPSVAPSKNQWDFWMLRPGIPAEKPAPRETAREWATRELAEIDDQSFYTAEHIINGYLERMGEEKIEND